MGKDIWTIPFQNLTQTLKASTDSFCNWAINSLRYLISDASNIRIFTLRRFSIWFRRCLLSCLFSSSISVFSTQPYSASAPLVYRFLWSASESQIHFPWYSNARRYPSSGMVGLVNMPASVSILTPSRGSVPRLKSSLTWPSFLYQFLSFWAWNWSGTRNCRFCPCSLLDFCE